MEEEALVYMDNIIQRALLPEMQDEAVNAVIHFLERHDAFDPVVGDAFSRYPAACRDERCVSGSIHFNTPNFYGIASIA